MPNTKSAIRRVRRVKKQTQVNRVRRSKYKNSIKKVNNYGQITWMIWNLLIWEKKVVNKILAKIKL